MEILINELSLSGQFDSVENFVETGLRSFMEVLKDIGLQSNMFFKKQDFYQTKITQQYTIYDVLKYHDPYKYEEVRIFKSLSEKLFRENFWDNNPKQSTNTVYSYNEKNVCGSSLAEACERGRMVISFYHNDYRIKKLSVFKNKDKIDLDNFFEYGHFTQIAYDQNIINFNVYCCKIFSCNKIFTNAKLDFSEIDSKEGFSLIKKDEESLFYDGFRKFSELSWQQIFVDDALDYKEYTNKRYFKSISEKIFKFRISRKYRCFGYVKGGVFFVLQFDLEHKLSDLG
jgi:hypothetical protein